MVSFRGNPSRSIGSSHSIPFGHLRFPELEIQPTKLTKSPVPNLHMQHRRALRRRSLQKAAAGPPAPGRARLPQAPPASYEGGWLLPEVNRAIWKSISLPGFAMLDVWVTLFKRNLCCLGWGLLGCQTESCFWAVRFQIPGEQ